MKLSKENIPIFLLGYLCLIYLSFTFITHGIASLLLNEKFIYLTMGIGFSREIATILIFLVGIMDIVVGILLLINRIPLLILYAGIWPLVPMVLTFIVDGNLVLGYISYLLIAAIAYTIFKNKDGKKQTAK